MDINRGDDKLIMVHFDPPDQLSPKHILNALNNDCIQEIFRRLHNIEDFVNMAEVCVRFQDNSRKCFPPIYKVFYSTHADNFDDHPDKLNKNLVLPLNRVQSFLSIFGDLIEKIVWRHEIEIYCREQPYKISSIYHRLIEGKKTYQDYDKTNLRILADNCGKSVNELQIRRRFIDFNILRRFQALETLQIEECRNNYVKASKHGLFPKLKYLKITDLMGDGGWLKQTFPKLIEAEFVDVNKFLDENTLIEFVDQNPQLKRLSVISHPYEFQFFAQDGIDWFIDLMLEIFHDTYRFFDF